MRRSSEPHRGRRGDPGWVRTAFLSVAAVGLVFAVTACGSSARSRAGSSAQPTYAQAEQVAVRFADCMRSHGVSGFPDPTSPYEFKFLLSPASGANQRSPAFGSAEAACAYLLPRRGQAAQSAAEDQTHTPALLAFARCLRRHGFPTFPDPTASGELTHEMVAEAGINLHQPAVVQAADACATVTHGVITKAIVARFIAGQ